MAASVIDEPQAPMMAGTLSRTISFSAALAASLGSDLLSSMTSSILRPLTPPARVDPVAGDLRAHAHVVAGGGDRARQRLDHADLDRGLGESGGRQQGPDGEDDEQDGPPALQHEQSLHRVECGGHDSRQANCTLVALTLNTQQKEGEMARAKVKAYKEQSFDQLQGLDGISDDQIAEHLKLYAGYVKQVNTLNEDLFDLLGKGKASGKDPAFAELTRRLGFEYNGMILHEYYFSNLRRAGEPTPPAASGLARALTDTYGNVEAWKTDFQAMGDMRGIGWVILFQDPATDRLTNHWVTLHQDGVPAGFKPLLVMDVWEHAFMRDYKATDKAKYVEAFFRNIDWQMVERRLREEAAVRPAAAA